MSLQNLVLLGLGIWLAAVSAVLFFYIRFFRRLTRGVSGVDLQKVITKILASCEVNSQEIVKLKRQIGKIEEDDLVHIQKVGLIKFNPFSEIGGEYSFSLAMLDGKNTGIVITGIHTRQATRIYSKYIKNGKPDIDLSEEEKKAIAKAQNIK
jgi:hypothetical protein